MPRPALYAENWLQHKVWDIFVTSQYADTPFTLSFPSFNIALPGGSAWFLKGSDW